MPHIWNLSASVINGKSLQQKVSLLLHAFGLVLPFISKDLHCLVAIYYLSEHSVLCNIAYTRYIHNFFGEGVLHFIFQT